jgi:hypothetical protein
MSTIRFFIRRFATMLLGLGPLLAVVRGDNAPTTNAPAYQPPADFPAMHNTLDWTWVHGAVFVPTNCVNEAQAWDQYDPVRNDRELHFASIYGVNVVRVYLDYFIYLKKKDEFLKDIEDFLTRADKYKIKTEFVFFDACWHNPDRAILKADYQYPKPVFGVHNSQWLKCPGRNALDHYATTQESLKAYVQDVVNAHKDDPRIAFWETYNEPNRSPAVLQLMKDSQQWIHETGTSRLCTATSMNKYPGGPVSDFVTFHQYILQDLNRPKTYLCSECMNRRDESVPGVVKLYQGKNGYIVWEFGIGRDNCRFPWNNNIKNPAKEDVTKPFHGLVYPDGHPWSVDDAKVWMQAATDLDARSASLPNASGTGSKTFDQTPFFDVTYYKDGAFRTVAKTSVTPFIDFDLDTEPGTGSPDASAGVPTENFSVMWKGTIQPPSPGAYTFYADCDDRVELSVNGKPVVSKTQAGRSEASGTVELDGHPATVEIKYQHGTGAPSLHVLWSATGATKQLLLPAKA